MISRARQSTRRGFSLIATLLIVVIIAIAIAGFLSVAGTESTTTHVSTLRAQARANAMVGLRTAIAQLQQYAGSDQRITAAAAILDANPETPAIEGVPHASWIGIWPTVPGEGSASWIYRDKQTGSLRDRRADSPESYQTGRESQALTWLVSSPEPWSPTEEFPEDAGDVITMVHTYDSERTDRPGEALVRKVPLKEIHQGTERTTGNYAYWVGDEGMKAKVNIANPYATSKLEPGNENEGGYRQLLVAPDTDYGMLLGALNQVEEDDKRRILVSAQLGSYLDLPPEPRGPRNSFQSMTAYSMGVLCNVRDGGLKTDLTPFFNGAGGGSSGINQNTQLFDGFKGASPTFGLLRDWARIDKELPIEEGALDVSFGPQQAAKGKNVKRAHRGMAQQLPKLHDLNQATAKPLLVEAGVFFSVSKVSAAEETVRLLLHLHPRVAIWNPYAVALKARPYAVLVQVESFALRLELPKGGSIGLPVLLPNTEDPENLTHIGETTGTLCFSLEPIELGPGECLVFSAAHKGTQQYQRSNVGQNLLSARERAGDQGFHLADCFGSENAGKFPDDAAPENYAFVESSSSVLLDQRMFLKAPSASGFSLGQALQAPTVHGISASKNPGERASELRSVPQQSHPIEQTHEPQAHWASHDGYRMRWVNGPEAIALSIFSQCNLHAFLSLRSPWDGIGNPELLARWNPYQRVEPDEALGVNNYPSIALKDRKQGGNPFSSPGNWATDRYVLFDRPRKSTGVLSIGQFQHAPLSKVVWNPSFAIGNSLKPIRIKDRTRTTPEFQGSDQGWNATMLGASDECADWCRGLIHNQQDHQLIYDISYEANHALWDRFFLGSGTTADRREFVNDPINVHLPNARMKLNDFVTRDRAIADLNDALKAASRMLVDGAFNVHSTEAEAWAAVLATNRELYFAESDHDDATPLPRHMIPRRHDPGSKLNEYRFLSDGDIKTLASEIVVEVKKRAPFVSMADFVNRRLVDDESGDTGTLQAAIDRSGINDIENSFELPQSPEERLAGGPSTVTQADLMTPLGPVLSARSDTFIIRAYGDVIGRNGKVASRAACEAIVQRTPEPVEPDATGINPSPASKLGRKFRIVSFKWTDPRR